MFTLHVISDLNYHFNEFSEAIDEIIPDVDLVIINGNISSHIKRSMLYAETLANKYPDIYFIFNPGDKDNISHGQEKFKGEGRENMKIRQWANSTWPKNLHFQQNIQLNLKSGDAVDVLCMFGFPKIRAFAGQWSDSYWYKNFVAEVTTDASKFAPKDVLDTHCGRIPVFADAAWINEQHDTEYQMVKKWEINETSYKILVTQINPYRDYRTVNQKVTGYNIHLHNMLWVTTGEMQNSINYVGAKLISNPGRGNLPRGKVFTIDT